MTLKKTITLSVVFHMVLFSAAFLLSAGLLKGSGNIPDQQVFFISLAEDRGQVTVEKKAAAEKLPDRQQKQTVKKETKQVIQEKETTKVVQAEVVIEKTDEPVEEETVIKTSMDAEEKEAVPADEEPVMDANSSMDQGFDDINEDENIVQASYEGPEIESGEVINGAVNASLKPGIIQIIASAIERVKSYPVLARKRGMEGTVHVSFRINESGKPDDIEIKKSSGFSILDRATVRVVKKAAPYPLIASRIEVPVAYRLEN